VQLTVELAGVTFGYGAEPVLSDATLRLHAGEVVVIAGPNGSGKSTILKLCVGLLTPWSGTIRVFDRPPTDPWVRRRIGYAPQGLRGATSLPVSVGEVVVSGLVPQKPLLARIGREDWGRVAAALEAVDLADLTKECMFELSGGQQQRAVLARALVSDPPLILLDEPTTGIDQRFRPVIAHELRARAERGATVVVVSHDPEDFHEVIDRVIDLGDERVRELTHDEVHEMLEGRR
jgi:zinc transport system ATP-binding protein